MIQFKCPACQQLLQASQDAVGKQVQCPCGHQLAVPVPAMATSRPQSASPTATRASNSPTAHTGSAPTSSKPSHPVPQPPSSSSGSVLISCGCGRKLKAPTSAIGKAVQCPCGKLLPVQLNHPTTSSAQTTIPPAEPPRSASPEGQSTETWLDQLPPAMSPHSTPPGSYGNSYSLSNDAVGEGADSFAGSGSKPQTKETAARAYLANAEREISQQRAYQASQSGDGIIDGGMVVSLMAMLGAAIWFFVGLYMGVIFFYPPVLFALGFIGFCKSLFSF